MHRLSSRSGTCRFLTALGITDFSLQALSPYRCVTAAFKSVVPQQLLNHEFSCKLITLSKKGSTFFFCPHPQDFRLLRLLKLSEEAVQKLRCEHWPVVGVTGISSLPARPRAGTRCRLECWLRLPKALTAEQSQLLAVTLAFEYGADPASLLSPWGYLPGYLSRELIDRQMNKPPPRVWSSVCPPASVRSLAWSSLQELCREQISAARESSGIMPTDARSYFALSRASFLLDSASDRAAVSALLNDFGTEDLNAVKNPIVRWSPIASGFVYASVRRLYADRLVRQAAAKAQEPGTVVL